MRTRKTSTDRKAEIVAATLVLVAERGSDRVTTQAVAERVGITQPGVFRHFPAKRDIWSAVADWVVAEAERRWAAATKPKDSPLAKVRAIIKAQMKFIQDTPAVPSLIFSRELHTENEELRQAFHGMAIKFHALLTGMARQSQANGELSRDLSPEDIASLLLTLTPGLAMRWSVSGRAFNLVREGERLLNILLDCLPRASGSQCEDRHDQT
jgi:AcrR family transcriptional regulator